MKGWVFKSSESRPSSLAGTEMQRLTRPPLPTTPHKDQYSPFCSSLQSHPAAHVAEKTLQPHKTQLCSPFRSHLSSRLPNAWAQRREILVFSKEAPECIPINPLINYIFSLQHRQALALSFTPPHSIRPILHPPPTETNGTKHIFVFYPYQWHCDERAPLWQWWDTQVWTGWLTAPKRTAPSCAEHANTSKASLLQAQLSKLW